MTFPERLPVYKFYNAFKDSVFRMGVYIGLCLFTAFALWLVTANRFPLFERFALERNILAITAMVLFAAIPVLRFIRRPGSLLGSGVIAWAVFSFLYRITCLFFSGLASWHSASQVFMAGVVIYLIAATLSWLGTVVWRVRASHAATRHNHQLT
jgi:hypothetical protein